MIKVFKSSSNAVAYNSESLEIYPLPAQIADSLTHGELNGSAALPDPASTELIDQRTGISGLVLMITQTCNLKCSYCFAETYMGSDSAKQIMKPSTAAVTVEKVFTTRTEIPWVKFFGGEPLIGVAAIREAVKASERYCSIHQARMPVFSIFTNGTLIDKDAINLFKAYNFTVTISMDGPRHIHDRQRRFPSGKGTYDIIKNKIDMLRSADIEVRIKAVYTENSRRYHATIDSTYDFLMQHGAQEVCLTPTMGGSSYDRLDSVSLDDIEQDFTTSTERIMDSWLTASPIILPYWIDILDTIISRKGKPHFCGAGQKVITIDCTGDVFPCYVLMSDGLNMGNVHDSDFPGERFKTVANLMNSTTKDSFPKCVRCWARKLCSPCYGDSFPESGTLSAPSEKMCVKIRSVARATLLKIAEFMSDDEKWKNFIRNYNKLQVS